MPSATMSSDTGTVPTRVTSSRFIGRSRELAELEAALADASAGRPSLAFIAGESGVGKTRLLQELERGALAAEARVVSGECVSLGDDELPYAPIVAALRSLTRDGDPVLDELGPATRAGLASLLPERGPRARRIELAPLTRSELAEQLEDILGAAPDDGRVARMYARSEGNPLFTEELLAAGLDGRGELPPTLRDALMVRVETLSDAAQELLRVLAVGGRMDHALLAAASGLDAGQLRDALREAVAGHIVVAGPDNRYRFRHALLREVVADDLLPGEDAELNRVIAQALDARAAAGDTGVHLAAAI